MRKAEKRRIGREKQEALREKNRLSGLEAQLRDQKAREKKHQETLIAKDELEIRKLRKNGQETKYVPPVVIPIKTLAWMTSTPEYME